MKLKLRKFDYLLIAVIIVLGIVFSLFFYRKSNYVTVTVKITEKNVLYQYSSPPAWFAYLFKKGMQEKDGLGRMNAEILDVYFYDNFIPQSYYEPTLIDKKAVYLTLRLNTVFNSRSNEYKYKGATIVAGESIRINFEKMLVEGLITHVEGLSDPFKSKNVYLKAKLNDYSQVYAETTGVDPVIAEGITVGDKVLDSKKQTVVEVLNKEVAPAQKNTFDSLGNVYLKTDPQRSDVVLTLKVKVKEVNEELYFFDDIRLKIGNIIPLNFKNINVRGMITDLSESKFD